MAVLHPFRALRPLPNRVEEVACVPYDVINAREASELAEGRPFSFLHVIRPEIDLPPGIDEHDDAVYEKGAENLRRFAESGVFVEDEEPALYVYRLIMDDRPQTGIFGCVSVADYDNDIILKHEKTRPDKENDRTRHILTQRAHAEPVMLTYRSTPSLEDEIAETKRSEALYDFTAVDGVRHTIWKVKDPGRLAELFRAGVERLYVADGHHRCKAASRAAAELRDGKPDPSNEFEYFPAVIFPVDEMVILPYNRIIYKLPEDFLDQLRERFELRESVDPSPSAPGNVSIYVEGCWYGITLPPTDRDSVADQLDVSRLSEHVLEPVLNISDPRTDPNLYFVGGIRGTQELERLVDDGEAEAGISLYATSVEELIAVSDAGLLMPPKSTWFEPKLRSGLLVHRF